MKERDNYLGKKSDSQKERNDRNGMKKKERKREADVVRRHIAKYISVILTDRTKEIHIGG